MKNTYYLSFYLFALFSKKVNKRNAEFAFSGMAYLSLFMGFNVISIIAFIELVGIISVNGKIVYPLIAILLMVINYYVLVYNNKDQAILAYYDEKYKKTKIGAKVIVGFIAYIILSFAICMYMAYLVKTRIYHIQ